MMEIAVKPDHIIILVLFTSLLWVHMLAQVDSK